MYVVVLPLAALIAVAVVVIGRADARPRLQRFVRTGFKRLPTEHLDLALRRLSA